MITTGIIREINKSSSDKYRGNLYGVEISIFKTPVGSMNAAATVNCACSLPGGIYSSYAVGDMVFIGFVDNEMAQPIILGRIYKGLEEGVYRSYGYLDSLKVQGTTTLSEKTTIGEITYEKLSNLVMGLNNGVSATKKVEVPKTILSSGWVDDTGKYKNVVDMTGSGVLATSEIEVIPKIDSTEDVKTAEIYPYILVEDDSITIYSKNGSAADINVIVEVKN